MHHVISIPAAAVLCGVGEAAIRRAFREGRIDLAFAWHVGRASVATYLNLKSVVRCYGVDAMTVDASIDKFTANAPVVQTPDGERWAILDLNEPMMFREPGAPSATPRSAPGVAPAGRLADGTAARSAATERVGSAFCGTILSEQPQLLSLHTG